MLGKKIAILIGGGDVPALNMCLKSLVYRMIDEGLEPVGVRKGWEGLINYNHHNPTTYGENFIELTKAMVRPIDRTPGSFLHSSRIDPKSLPRQLVPQFISPTKAETQDLTAHIKDTFERLGFQALVVLGDIKALQYAAHLSKQGIPTIGIPKTIHNNVPGTDYTLGFTTGLARGVSFIHELRSLAGSREQIIVVEPYRVNSGIGSLMVSFLAGVDRVLIPEVSYDPEKLTRLVLQDKAMNPANYAVVLVCDGATITEEKVMKYTPHLSPRSQSQVLRMMTAEKAKKVKTDSEFNLEEVVETGSSLVGSGMVATELLTRLTGTEVFFQSMVYLLRTGTPDGQDLLGATNFAILTVRLLKDAKYGRMVAYQRYKLMDIDLAMAAPGVHQVNVAEMYDVENYQPKLNLISSAVEY